MTEHAERPITHETSDVSDANVRTIFGFGLGLLAVAIAVHVIILLVFNFFEARERHQAPSEYPLAAAQQNRLPPEPRLQTNPRQDLADLRAREDATLTTYGWVDKNAGMVRIPIDEAIRLTVERGVVK
jgi:hypothetical protein